MTTARKRAPTNRASKLAGIPRASAPAGASRPAIELKLVAIGNSRGVRLPRAVLAKYAMGEVIVLEEREEGLLLRSGNDRRLSWEDTYKDMARAREDWGDLDVTVGDGLDKEPW